MKAIKFMRFRIIKEYLYGNIAYKIQKKAWYGWKILSTWCGSFGKNEFTFDSVEEAEKFIQDRYKNNGYIVVKELTLSKQ